MISVESLAEVAFPFAGQYPLLRYLRDIVGVMKVARRESAFMCTCTNSAAPASSDRIHQCVDLIS